MISPTDRLERRLLILAGAFLGAYSMALTLSNAVRLDSWQVNYRWGHWLGLLVWVGVVYLAHRQLARLLPERDPYLFPVAALLTGWGLLTIWRLSSVLALRQTAWLLLVGMAFILALRLDWKHAGGRILTYLRRFKYIWLTSGLLLTAGTLFLGTNPLGAGPRLWLGWGDIYFQPSELLKLLLIIYLAAYLADSQASTSSTRKLLPLLTPTLIMTDLGTAAIFMVLYAVIVYAGTGNKNILVASVVVLALAGVAGYALFDVVNQRVVAWINPWLDPSGRSYQIVQSLLAVANGGIFGRGAGMGSPNLVPIAQSDFIFAAITEESGLVGAVGILALLALLANRGMRTAMKAQEPFQRLLAIGLVVHLVGQSILIIAGNLRLLPLTGVTLPFVSNGGSSLLVSSFELLCLLLISSRPPEVLALRPEQLKSQTSVNLLLSGGLMLGLAGAALIAGWWTLVRGPDLLNRTDNPRRSIADRYVLRGAILDRRERPLAESRGQPGSYVRDYLYPALGPLVGYTDPLYGQAGLEASLDPYLRGMKGYPTLTMSWEQLLYGEPPPGLDVRTSLDLDLQTRADQLLAGRRGALVLLNAQSGEILALASSPAFDANTLDANWEMLLNDPASPLFNRATMGMYPAGNALDVFLMAAGQPTAANPLVISYPAGCAIPPTGTTWGAAIAAGCAEPTRLLAGSLSTADLLGRLDRLGFFTAPAFPVETLSSARPKAISDAVSYLTGLEADPVTGAKLRVSPLQMAMAAASLVNGGEIVSPRLAMAVANPRGGWVMLAVNGQAGQATKTQGSVNLDAALADKDLPVWQVVSNIKLPDSPQRTNGAASGYTWYLGGTLPEWKGASIAIAVLLEENDSQEALKIGRSLLQDALIP